VDVGERVEEVGSHVKYEKEVIFGAKKGGGGANIIHWPIGVGILTEEKM